MPRDTKIMSEALRRFQADKERRSVQLERRREEVYRKAPAVERIDQELRSTAARVVAAAFSQDGDPEEALEKLAAGNLALQRERAELLVGAGRRSTGRRPRWSASTRSCGARRPGW